MLHKYKNKGLILILNLHQLLYKSVLQGKKVKSRNYVRRASTLSTKQMLMTTKKVLKSKWTFFLHLHIHYIFFFFFVFVAFYFPVATRSENQLCAKFNKMFQCISNGFRAIWIYTKYEDKSGTLSTPALC